LQLLAYVFLIPADDFVFRCNQVGNREIATQPRKPGWSTALLRKESK